MLLRCIDLETLSLDPKDGVCEAARCDLTGDGSPGGWKFVVHSGTQLSGLVTGPESTFVDPKRPIPPEASAIHHIVDADVAGARLREAASNWLIEGSEGIFAAHNAKFEQAYFNPPGSRWIDTYKIALHLAPQAPAHNLQTLRYWLKLEVDPAVAMPPHRAGPDTYVTARLLQRMLAKLAPEEMIEISSRPAILPKLHFGKHAMKPLAEVPTDYLEWMVKQADMDADAKATAAHNLKLRARG